MAENAHTPADPNDTGLVILRLLDKQGRLETEIGRLRAENAEMREALKPFAEADGDLEGVDRADIWEHPAALIITIGDLRAARAAIARATTP